MKNHYKRRALVHISAAEVAAKNHIVELRKNKFSIGTDVQNPLTEDFHHAVTCLSAELYTKDVHFLMELLQNAEDNQYAESVEPTLEFALTTRDITGCGASETLLVFNNEVGFSWQNMESICSVGRSTKKGKRNQGFIGEKGIGFKSVFLVSKQPHIISNGYKVKFNEEPDEHCGIGYIVPEWIYEASFIAEILEVYGLEKLSGTIIVLPLKDDKVKSVKEEIFSLHPELLLFLSKLQRLFVHQDKSNSKEAGSVTAISIVNETNHAVSRDKHADSRVVHLSVKETSDAPEERCQYYIWRQTFPVVPEARVGGRAHVQNWVVSLAFPFGNRLKRGASCVGVFAYLPTSMVTRFPFVIQADFILASSREAILFDSQWNQGILDCVPVAFVNAFKSCVTEGSPVFTAAQAFEFLPSQHSPFPELNKVRESIRTKLINKRIVPCETFTKDIAFCKPALAVRILPGFRDILFRMKMAGISLADISTMKLSPLHSSLDQEKYQRSLEFLNVSIAGNTWYESCITACNLISQSSDNIYIDVLYFLGCQLHFNVSIPVLKFTNEMGKIDLCTIAPSTCKTKYGRQFELHAWLQKCNLLFGCPNKIYFLPNSVQNALMRHSKGKPVSSWLGSFGIKSCTASEYSSQLCDYVSRQRLDTNTMVTFCQFLYHSHLKGFLTVSDVSAILKSTPVIDGSGRIRLERALTLVPASGSKWIKLLGPSNPFIQMRYVDIGEAYAVSGEFAGERTPEKRLLSFLVTHSGARDLPELAPPNHPLLIASSLMTSEQAFLLLNWIRFHRTSGSPVPFRFLQSIQCGKWVKTTAGVDCPRNCTLPTETGRAILEIVKHGLASFSILDEEYYGEQISSYMGELQFLGVKCAVNGVQGLVMDHFKGLASLAMDKDTALSLFMFVGFLKARKMLDEQWLNSVSKGRWLKTCREYAAPKDSVFFHSDSEAAAAGMVTSLNVIDGKFYGETFFSFTEELKLLGVKSGLEMYQLMAVNLTLPETPTSFSSDTGFFLLNCLRNSNSPGLIETLRCRPWLKTSTGFKSPSTVILHEQNLASLLDVVQAPVIDEKFYGDELRSYMEELQLLGVAVKFEDVLKTVVDMVKTNLSSSKSPIYLITLLHCIAAMKRSMSSELDSMCQHLREEEIMKTRHGYKMPKESILFNSKWASISFFVDLPLVDDSFYGITIYGLRDELKMMGVLSSLEDGATFVARGLSSPIKTELLTADGTLVLLDCLKALMAIRDPDTGSSQLLDGSDDPSFSAFLDNLKKSELLKTSDGYRLPQDSCLLHGDWKEMLEPTDAPFLDNRFYGRDMSAYLSELEAIGVKANPMEICTVLSQSLCSFSETTPIKRIYSFLNRFQWKPNATQSTNDGMIWIPVQDACSEGKWVQSSRCLLHDKAQFFSPILFSLESFYENDLLSFFSTAFGVVESPSFDHYLEIWNLWESRESHKIFDSECYFFWTYVLKNWNQQTEDSLKKNLLKVPTSSPGGDILLVRKEHVFVADDLLLKKMFMDGDSPLFVWLPSSSMFSVVQPRKLCTVYDALGVCKLSKSVKCSVTIQQTLDHPDGDLKRKIIVKGLVEMILGFLASKIQMPANERHEAVKSLLNVSVFEHNESVRVSYQLHVSVVRCIEREVVKLVHWDKKSQKLFIDGSFSENQKASAKFVNSFAAEVSQGLLPRESVTVVTELRNLIQLGYLYDFEEQSVRFLLTRENIEVLLEDVEFIASEFTLKDDFCAKAFSKRGSSQQELAPLTPNTTRHKRKRLLDLVSVEEGGQSVSNSMEEDVQFPTKKQVAAKGEVAKDTTKPKRPLTPFFMFMDEFRQQYKLELSHGTATIVDVTKAGSERWRAMSENEKAPYVELWTKRKVEFGKEMEAYNKRLLDCLKLEPQSDDSSKDEGLQ